GVYGLVAFVAFQRDLGRAPVGRRGILPGAHAREDVRRHVQRVRRVGSDAGVALGGRHALLRDRRRVIAVDEVVRDARMVRILGELLLQYRRRLERIAVGLVGLLLDGNQV